jgi:hypothetical protein
MYWSVHSNVKIDSQENHPTEICLSWQILTDAA